MRIAVLTVAGISSRFNQGIEEDRKVLKCLYTEGGSEDTLLYHLLKKCSFADKIIIVGGYKFDDLKAFYENILSREFPQIELVYNEHYADLSSGYSLYLGVNKAVKYSPEEILFVEGDLDIDEPSFENVVRTEGTVLTYTYEPIHAEKSVVLYKNGDGRYKYTFSSAHGLLSIDEPFSCMLNSGQTWKFNDMDALTKANHKFFESDRTGTNLVIIQSYIDSFENNKITLVPLKKWTNCNTRADYEKIKRYWEEEAI